MFFSGIVGQFLVFGKPYGGRADALVKPLLSSSRLPAFLLASSSQFFYNILCPF
jgi:hypothetical protein